MNLFMEALEKKLRIKGGGVSNSNFLSEGKLGDWEETKKDSKKEHEKEKFSSSVVNHSQSIIKTKSKFDINPYQGEIDALKLNH